MDGPNLKNTKLKQQSDLLIRSKVIFDDFFAARVTIDELSDVVLESFVVD